MFDDRVDAGRQLAQKLDSYMGQDSVVLGLPRGGVPVAAEVAAHLGAPLDIIGVRKLGVPWQEELAMGAIGEGGIRLVNEALRARLGVTAEQLAEVEKKEHEILTKRLSVFREGAAQLPVSGKIAIVVDDGMATGSTAAVACAVARARGAREVVLAVPVAPIDEAREFSAADTVVVVDTPEWFGGVGSHYRHFDQTTDDEVVALLRKSRQKR